MAWICTTSRFLHARRPHEAIDSYPCWNNTTEENMQRFVSLFGHKERNKITDQKLIVSHACTITFCLSSFLTSDLSVCTRRAATSQSMSSVWAVCDGWSSTGRGSATSQRSWRLCRSWWGIQSNRSVIRVSLNFTVLASSNVCLASWLELIFMCCIRIWNQWCIVVLHLLQIVLFMFIRPNVI